MKILIFHQFYTSLNEAGISRFNIFADYWRKNGAEVWVITGDVNYMTGKKTQSNNWKIFTKEIDNSGLNIIRATSFSFGFSYRSFIGRLFSYFSFTLTSFLAGFFIPWPDVIIASTPPIFLGVSGWLLSFLRRVPFVYEMRDIWPDETIELGVIKNKLAINLSYKLEKFLYENSSLVMVNSPGVKEFLIKEKDVPAVKIGVVVNPIYQNLSKEKFSLREQFDLKNKLLVVYTGSHSMVYDFDSLLDAAIILKDNPRIVFVLIGDGRQKASIERRIKEEKIENVISLPAMAKDRIPTILAEADICIASLKNMRLLRYIYATKIFDYMLAAKPIVLAMDGVSAELVCDSAKAGACLKPGDSHGLAEAIKLLSQSVLKRKSLGTKGLKFVQNYADPEKLALEYLKLLKPIIVPKR